MLLVEDVGLECNKGSGKVEGTATGFGKMLGIGECDAADQVMARRLFVTKVERVVATHLKVFEVIAVRRRAEQYRGARQSTNAL